MRPKNFKGGRCIKTKLKKCEEVARTYDKIQTAYADVLDKDKNVEVIKCNVLLENLEDGEFTTDFLCTKTNGDLRDTSVQIRFLLLTAVMCLKTLFADSTNPMVKKQEHTSHPETLSI